MFQPTSGAPDPSKISLGFKNLLGQQKQVTLKDLENWQKGKGKNFFVRTFNQVRSLFNSNALVTDARVKEMMKRMDPATMKQITESFKEALKEPEKKPEMLELAHVFSKYQGSIGRKNPDFSQSAITQVYDLKQVLQIGSAAKMLTDFGVENLLKSIVLEGVFHRNDVGFKAAGVGGDFIEFYKGAEDKSDIKQVYKNFIQHTIDQGNKGKDLKGYPKDQAIYNYRLYAALSAIENLGKDHPFEQIKDKNVKELASIMGKQIQRQTSNLETLTNVKNALTAPQNMTKKELLKLIKDPVSNPIMKEILNGVGKGKAFKFLQEYTRALEKEIKLPQEGSGLDQYLESCVEYVKNPKSQGKIQEILGKHPQVRTEKAEASIRDILLEKKMTAGRLSELIENPQTRPMIKELFEIAGRGKDFQFQEHYLKAWNLGEQSYAEKSQSKANKLERKQYAHAEKMSNLLGDRYSGDLLDSNLDFIRNVRNQFELKNSVMTPKLLLEMVRNPLSRPFIENAYAHHMNDVSFQFFAKAAEYEEIQEKLGKTGNSDTKARLKKALEDKGNEIEDLIKNGVEGIGTLNIETPQMKRDLKDASLETKIQLIRDHLLPKEVGQVDASIRKALLSGEKLSIPERAKDIENPF